LKDFFQTFITIHFKHIQYVNNDAMGEISLTNLISNFYWTSYFRCFNLNNRPLVIMFS